MIIKIIILIINPNFNSNLFKLFKINTKNKIPLYVIKLFIYNEKSIYISLIKYIS